MRIAVLTLALLIVHAVPDAHAADVVVTACGTVVAAGDHGTLHGDLDCSGAPASQPAIVLANRAALSLGGFTLTAPAGGTGVRCARHCDVEGPGIITSAPAGPGSAGAACIRALHDDGEPARSQKVTIAHLALTGCGTGAGGDTGPSGAKLTVTDVVADGNNVGFMGAAIRAHDVTASHGTGAGLWAPTGKITGVGVHADANDPVGVEAARLSLTDSTATGNTAFGVRALAGATTLRRTTVTGSGLGDVVSARPPHVTQVTCDTSARWIPPNGLGASWGVCSGD